jgi:cytochrome c
VVVLRAAYTDRGAGGLPGASAERALVLRAPIVVVATGQLSEGVQKMTVPQVPVEMSIVGRSGSHAKLERLDLTGISAVVFSAMAPAQYQALGGTIEVRRDSATGPLLGETETIQPTADAAGPPAQLRATLKPTTGVHDLYFVFRNAAATGPGMLFVVLTATFESGAGAGSGAGAR